jgi:hypothetical protein
MILTKLFYFIAPLIGLVTLVIGISAVLKPRPMSKEFGIAVDGLALQYVISTGIRDVFMGLAVLILYFQQNWTALGAIHLCLGIVAISDFVVVRRHGNKSKSQVHLFGAIAVIGYGFWLLS